MKSNTLSFINNYRLDLNRINHFFCVFLFGLAFNNFASFLLRARTLNLQKSFSCCLLFCLATNLPSLLSLKTFATFYLAMSLFSFPDLIPLPIFKVCLVNWSLEMGMVCLAKPYPSMRTLLSLTISTMVASFPSRGPKLILATLPT